MNASSDRQISTGTRTHQCGNLRADDDGFEVTIAGWLLPTRRVSKSLGFFRLRDASGDIQVVIRPRNGGEGQGSEAELLDSLTGLPLQSVISVRGIVRRRPPDMINPRMTTGEVEVELVDLTVLNQADRELPFYPHDASNLANEALRARYRYLDLRRPELARNIQLRSKVAHTVRSHLHEQGFSEVETPILLRSTPEGAAEFLVPTRLSKNPGGSGASEPLFYALPQSPQQPKQLLIASGCVDQYYQFAKCFRDEDSRKDRQVEFTQIDMEMGFVSLERPADEADWRMGGIEVRKIVEGTVQKVWKEVKGVDLLASKSGLPVLTYQEAMERYGSDKPDRRFGMRIWNLSPSLRSHDEPSPLSEEDCIASTVEILVCPTIPDVHSTKSMDQLTKEVLSKIPGEAIERFRGNLSSPHELAGLLLKKSRIVATHLAAVEIPASTVEVEALAARLEEALSEARRETPSSETESCFVFVSRRPVPAIGGSTILGDLRLALASRAEAAGIKVRSDEDDMFWVTEFPLFSQNVDASTGSPMGWSSTHHPFTAPMAEDLHLLEGGKPSNEVIAKVRGQHYDLVLNGTEIGGGSVRVHQAGLQESIMRDVLGLSDGEVSRFAHLLHALRCGAPPHGGIALGELV